MRILMVCLGNICRSPMAEAVLAHLVAGRKDAAGWTIDSAGTGDWHVGHPPDHRTIEVLHRHGIRTTHRARQVQPGDFTRFDVIYAMDRKNLANLEHLRPEDATATIRLLGHHDPQGESEVPDPYYDGRPEFEQVYDQVHRCCEALLADQRG